MENIMARQQEESKRLSFPFRDGVNDGIVEKESTFKTVLVVEICRRRLFSFSLESVYVMDKINLQSQQE
jgi:hypothetical protein